MAGNKNSGRVTPRSERDEATFALHDQVEDLRVIVELAAHIRRRALNVGRLNHRSRAALRRAQDLQDAQAITTADYSGPDRRQPALEAA